jgi:hypothetical protein
MVVLHPIKAPEQRLAIDLSGSSIRVLEGAPGGAMRCAETSVSPRALAGGRVVDPGLLGHALRNLLVKHDFGKSRALVAAGDAVATFRVLDFPSGTHDAEVDAAVKAELPPGDARLGLRHVEVSNGAEGRTVYAMVWDRGQVEAISVAVKEGGLDPAVVDLKSLCLARAVPMRSFVLVDVTSHPGEVVLIDDRLPRVRHTFDVEPDGDVAAAMTAAIKPVLSFYRPVRPTDFGPETPILLRSDGAPPPAVVRRLEQLIGRPVEAVPRPQRIDPDIDHSPYLTCIGLTMRRRS